MHCICQEDAVKAPRSALTVCAWLPMHCKQSERQVCRKQQTACAVNARGCRSWQPSTNAIHASSELTAPFLQVIACSQQQPDIMFGVLLRSGHLQNVLVMNKSPIHRKHVVSCRCRCTYSHVSRVMYHSLVLHTVLLCSGCAF